MGREVDVASDETLLEALLHGDVDYPHGCSSGLCSLCKSRLVSGRIEHLDAYASALSDAEKQAGLLLACRSHALADCSITPVQQAAHLPPVVRLEARVSVMEPLTHDIVRLGLEPMQSRPFEFMPGQYARLRFGDAPPRDFSFASRPGVMPLEFFVRKVPGGHVTDTVLSALALGDRVQIQGPYGAAYLRESHIGPVIAVAGGSGLGPIRSIVSSALARGMTQPIRVYFGVRTPQDVYLAEEFAALRERHPNLFFSVLLAEGPEAVRPHEHLREALHGEDLSTSMAYVAGPPAMVNAVSAVLGALSLPQDACHVDPFLTAAQRPSP